jgi:hypothetical protein
MIRLGCLFVDSITHFLLTTTNVFERSSKSVSLQPALLQIQKAEMDSSDCVLMIVNQAHRNEYLATSNSAPAAIVRQFKGFR